MNLHDIAPRLTDAELVLRGLQKNYPNQYWEVRPSQRPDFPFEFRSSHFDQWTGLVDYAADYWIKQATSS